MTDDIVAIKKAMTELKPPSIWTHDTAGNEISWLTNSVANWHNGLILRNDRLREWLNSESGSRPAFWLPGFINPKGFFAAFRQEVYKTKKDQPRTVPLTLDMINLTFKPDKTEVDPEKWKLNNRKKTEKNVVSMLTYGLFIEGCAWNGYLTDDYNDSRNPVGPFPVIIVTGDSEKPQANNNANANTNPPYKCPLYKYPRRTDGYLVDHIYLQIKSDTKASFWKKRGVALLCNKD
jgi:dynein heavy chain